MRRRQGQNEAEGAPYKAGEKISERYPVMAVAGPGPCGWVFRCRDIELEVDVAVKLVHPRLLQTPDEREHFSQAMRLSRKFTHPGLARSYDEGVDANGWPFFTQPFVEGLTLQKIIEQRLASGQFFLPGEVEPIVSQLVKALEAAHAHGPHLNLKPTNIVIQPDLLKVTDFGLGIALPRVPFIQAERQASAHRFLAPEFLAGFEVDGRADQYALGVMVGWMLSGQLPENAANVPQLGTKNPTLHPELEGFYRKAVAERADGRFKTLGDLLADFRRLASTHTVRARMPKTPATVVDTDGTSKDATIPMSVDEIAEKFGLPGIPGRTVPMRTPPPVPPRETTPMPLQLAAPEPRTPRPSAFVPFEAPPRGPPPPPPLSLPPRLAPPPSLPPPSLPVPDAPRAAVGEISTRFYPNPLEAQDDDLSVPPLFAGARKEPVMAKPAVFWPLLMLAGGLLGIVLGWEVVGYMRHGDSDVPAAIATAAKEPSKQAKDGATKDASKEGKKAGAPGDPPKQSSVVPAAGKVIAPPGGCPPDMKLIPSGTVRTGSAPDDPLRGADDKTLSAQEVNAYCIDTLEYPNQAGASPQVNISWTDAQTRCEAQGKRLCREAEWEKACKGVGNLRFPYGAAASDEACNTLDAKNGALVPAGKSTTCQSSFGVGDLSGNAAEWVQSPFGKGQDKTQKGGSFKTPGSASRCASRVGAAASASAADVGFRCCMPVGK
jgi:serine/threonine protein kinase